VTREVPVDAYDSSYVFEPLDATPAAEVAFLANGFSLSSIQAFAAIPFLDSASIAEETS
jgi:hypothetical protein